jgi:hypothetical protein
VLLPAAAARGLKVEMMAVNSQCMEEFTVKVSKEQLLCISFKSKHDM